MIPLSPSESICFAGFQRQDYDFPHLHLFRHQNSSKFQFISYFGDDLLVSISPLWQDLTCVGYINS